MDGVDCYRLLWFVWLCNRLLIDFLLRVTGEGAEKLEGSLLNMFGLKHRPRPRRENIVIPDFLVELYRHQTGLDVDTTNLNLRGKMTHTANTVRTFANQGNFLY